MKMKKTFKKIVVFATAFTIAVTSTMSISREVFANEETRLELFNQLADKVTSLYYREAVVGLKILDDIYSDPKLKLNIEKYLDEDVETKKYLRERGFNKNKINEIINFIDIVFPSVDEMQNKDDRNIIKKLIKIALVEENKTLSFTDYDEDIKLFGKSLYEILPDGVSDAFDIYFETEEEKIDAILKILIEFIYNGHGKVYYDKDTKEYMDLKLRVDEKFIKNVNGQLKVEILNENSKKSINIFLKALEDTIKENELEIIYSDLSIVLNLLDTNDETVARDENSLKEVNVRSIEEKDITRSEVLKLVLEALSLEPTEYTNEFTDVKDEDFYSGYIAKAKNIGIINGYKDNTFRPNAKVTKDESISIISRALDYLHGNEEISQEQIDNALKGLKHNKKIEIWARKSVAKLVMLGLLESDYDGEFGRNAFINREETIKLIDKIKM